MRLNALDRAIAYLAPERALARVQARAKIALANRIAGGMGGTRRYDAAGWSRGTEGWGVPFTSSNSEVYYGLPWLRARAHDLARNNPHARRAVDALTDMLAGDGIVCQAKTGDAKLDSRVNALWAEWVAQAHSGDRHTFYGLQRMSARAIVEGGEVVWRRWRRRSDSGLAVPVQFQVMEGELIDHLRNEVLDNGDRVIAGIHLDASERRKAYWLYEQHPGDGMLRTGANLKSDPVDAANIRHCFEELRPGQLRGVPWLTASIVRMRTLDDYEEAEQYRKRFEAALAAIVIGNETEGGNVASLMPKVHDASGNNVEMLEPGLVAYLDSGTDVKFTQPAPGTGFQPFKRSALQSIATGMGLTYEMVSGDLSGTNYSSIRAGMLGVRSMIRAVQKTTFIPQICNPTYRDFIDTAVAVGLLPAGTPYSCSWHPPRFESVDPEKEARAIVLKVRAGVTTLAQAIAAEGYDVEAQLDEITAVNKLIDDRHLVLDSDPRFTSQRGIGQPDNSTPADEDTDLPTPDADLVEPDKTKDRMRDVLRLIARMARTG